MNTIEKADALTPATYQNNNSESYRQDTTDSAQCELINHISNNNGLSEYEHLRITDSTDIPDLEPVIKIAGEVIAAKGDLIGFSGAVKSGKSSTQDPIIATAITKDGIINDPIEEMQITPNNECFGVIHIDTEQSKSKHKQKVKGILRRANLQSCPPHFLSYNFKALDLEELRPITTSILQAAAKKFGKVHMVVIDGIADYIADPNNTEQSNSIVKYFDQVATEYECVVLVIIHTNPGSDKERGNIGSQLIRKVASMLSIKVEDDITYMEPKYLRYAGRKKVPTIQFAYDVEKGYHVCCGVKAEGSSGRPSLKDKLQEAVDKILAPPKSLGYTKIIRELMEHFSVSERTAVTRWKDIQAFELVTQGADKNWRKAA